MNPQEAEYLEAKIREGGDAELLNEVRPIRQGSQVSNLNSNFNSNQNSVRGSPVKSGDPRLNNNPSNQSLLSGGGQGQLDQNSSKNQSFGGQSLNASVNLNASLNQGSQGVIILE